MDVTTNLAVLARSPTTTYRSRGDLPLLAPFTGGLEAFVHHMATWLCGAKKKEPLVWFGRLFLQAYRMRAKVGFRAAV
jgi:hypothetical protein